MIFRAIVAVDTEKEYAKYVVVGKLKKLGSVRYVLAKDLAFITNTMMDEENFSANSEQKKKDEGVTAKTVSEYARNQFRLPVERSGTRGGGNAVVLDQALIAAGKFRFGIEDEEKPPTQLEMKT